MFRSIKNTVKLVLMVMLTLVVLRLFTGCEESSGLEVGDPVALAVVYCARENNAVSEAYFDLAIPGDKDSMIYNAATPGSIVAVFTTSKNPIQAETITVPESDAKFQEDVAQDQQYYARKIKDKILTVKANAAEADLYTALKLAAAFVKNAPSTHKKRILVIDNGIVTSGPLSFPETSVFLASPQTILQSLEKHGEKVDFAGAAVVFASLGQTSGTQDSPKGTNYNRLIRMWQQFVRHFSGSPIVIESRFQPHDLETAYKVTPFVFPPEQPLELEAEGEIDFRSGISLTEEVVQFLPNTSDLLDEDAAMSVLKPVAEALFKQKEPVLVVGTTAGDEASGAFEFDLSLARAEEIRRILVQLGVAPDGIETLGLANDNPWHIKGLGVGEEASVNRKVVILTKTSPTAQEILSSHRRP